MIGWRKNSWNLEWVSSVFTFVCVSVCVSVHGLQSKPFDLGTYFFGLNYPWDMRKGHIFFFFFSSKFIFMLFIGIFLFFSNNYAFQDHYSPRGVIFHIFFQFLWDLCKGTGDYWYNHSMWPIILVYFFPTNGNNKNPFWALDGKTRPLVLNSSVTFVPGSVCCRSAWCLSFF